MLRNSDLGSATRSAVSRAVFGTINGVQTIHRPGDRVVGVAATLLLIAREHHLDVSALLQVAQNVLLDSTDRTQVRPELRAAQQYVRNEL